jgi:hypothetical protein
MNHERHVEQVRVLAGLTEDELLTALGQQLCGDQVVPLDPRDLLERGKRYFESQWPKLEKVVCVQSTRDFCEGKSDAADIAIEVLKLLSSVALPFSPVALAVLVAKKGLKRICAARWQEIAGGSR